jgi:hypothetical protein
MTAANLAFPLRIVGGSSSTGLGLCVPSDVVSGLMGCHVGQGEQVDHGEAVIESG